MIGPISLPLWCEIVTIELETVTPSFFRPVFEARSALALKRTYLYGHVWSASPAAKVAALAHSEDSSRYCRSDDQVL